MHGISFVQTTLDLCSLTGKVFENVRRPTVIYSYSSYVCIVHMQWLLYCTDICIHTTCVHCEIQVF